MGLVSENFTKASVIGRLKGENAIGHVRYSTTGDTILRNVQPLFADFAGGGFALAHGNLANALSIRNQRNPAPSFSLPPTLRPFCIWWPEVTGLRPLIDL